MILLQLVSDSVRDGKWKVYLLSRSLETESYRKYL